MIMFHHQTSFSTDHNIAILQHNLPHLWRAFREFNLFTFLVSFVIIVFITITFKFNFRSRPVYLMDFSCFKPPEDLKISRKAFIEHLKKSGELNEQSLQVQVKAMESSGIGDHTYLPSSVILANPPIDNCMKEARREAEMVMFAVIDELFEKTKVRPKDISVLVVNCGLFSPTPSLSAMVINHYKMRENILSFNISGMGCSAGIIALDLANDMLQVYKATYAIVVSTENITSSLYTRNQTLRMLNTVTSSLLLQDQNYMSNTTSSLYTQDRMPISTNITTSLCTENQNSTFVLPTTLFRLGGTAILLSNKQKDKSRARYQLQHIIRTHNGSHDTSFRSIYQEEERDIDNKKVLSLSSNVIRVTQEAIKTNIITLAPLVLPLRHKFIFLITQLCKKVLKSKDTNTYIPVLKHMFQYFCVHIGGGQHIFDEIQKTLKLGKKELEASRMTLHRFGNTSSSSIWYELAYLEAKGKVKREDKVLQIAYGSGFKCNSVVWKALRNVKKPKINPWLDSIDIYPIEIPKYDEIDLD